MTIEVGSIVRAKRPLPGSEKTFWSKAVVADIEDDAATATLLWEPLTIHPIPPCTLRDWVIVPKSLQTEADEEDETTVKLSEVQELLPFEDATTKADLEIAAWKERGDTLLRLGDASSAASYYERGLHESNVISIGSTVVVSAGGFPRLAEVDCIEEEDGNVDIALVESGEEKTVKKSAILLGIKEMDPEQLQERMLLNLSRCMLQLSDLDSFANKSKYLKAAILATSLVITISCSQNSDDGDLPTNAQTALVLRAKAQISLSKWPQAKQDAAKLVKSGNEQGTKLLATIERKKKLQAKSDKKLAKEMCKLVQSTTTNGSVSSSKEPKGTT
ncbi:MAG: hypothetical protein SGARI_005832, partial [Bacillariaceae sp.]